MSSRSQPHASGRCGAKTRSGAPCRSHPVHGRYRCRMHGGTSPGAPKGNRNAWKHGLCSAAAKARRRAFRELLKALQEGTDRASGQPVFDGVAKAPR